MEAAVSFVTYPQVSHSIISATLHQMQVTNVQSTLKGKGIKLYHLKKSNTKELVYIFLGYHTNIESLLIK